jgi:hypothetical protein
MDISCNLIDLKYLINPAFASLLDDKQQTVVANNEDIRQYKRRIFLLTKDFLNGKQTQDIHINTLFDRYASHCIEYFKFSDKKDIIQEDYKNLVSKKNLSPTNSNINPDNIIMKKPQQRIPRITDHINITTTINKKKIIIPQVRNLKGKKKKGKKKK